MNALRERAKQLKPSDSLYGDVFEEAPIRVMTDAQLIVAEHEVKWLVRINKLFAKINSLTLNISGRLNG